MNKPGEEANFAERIYLIFWSALIFWTNTDIIMINCERCKQRKGKCRVNHFPIERYFDPRIHKRVFDLWNKPNPQHTENTAPSFLELLSLQLADGYGMSTTGADFVRFIAAKPHFLTWQYLDENRPRLNAAIKTIYDYTQKQNDGLSMYVHNNAPNMRSIMQFTLDPAMMSVWTLHLEASEGLHQFQLRQIEDMYKDDAQE